MNTGQIGTAARWIARIIGLLFFGTVSLFVVAHAFSPEGLPIPWQQPAVVQIDLLALFLMTIGPIVGWKSESVASAMILCGYLMWRFVEPRVGWTPGLIEIALLAGVFYALAWWCSTRLSTPSRRPVQ